MKKLTKLEAELLARAVQQAADSVYWLGGVAPHPINPADNMRVHKAAEIKAAESLVARGLFYGFTMGGYDYGTRYANAVTMHYYGLTRQGFEFVGTSPKRLLLAKLADEIAQEDNHPVEWPSAVVSDYNLAFFRELYKDPNFTAAQVTEHEIYRIANNRANYERRYNELCLKALNVTLVDEFEGVLYD